MHVHEHIIIVLTMETVEIQNDGLFGNQEFQHIGEPICAISFKLITMKARVALTNEHILFVVTHEF